MMPAPALPMLDPADTALLAEVQHALSHPYRDPVRLGGGRVRRRFARQVERNLLRGFVSPSGGEGS